MSSDSGIIGDYAIRFTNSGVEFSWGVENGDGGNSLRYTFVSDTATISELSGNWGFAPSETFVLQPDGPGASQTQFFGTSASTINLSFSFNVGTLKVQFVGDTTITNTFSNKIGPDLITGITGQFSEIRFSTSFVDDGGFNQVTVLGFEAAGVNCFAPGTLIETVNGPLPVEELSTGDVLKLADGQKTTVVHWIGRRSIDARLADPARVNPVCITKDAFGRNRPKRDLRVSPDHAIEIGGLLINAIAMVNGTTIYQERDAVPKGFTYFHVETDAHDLLLAEGIAVESFVDYSTRSTFENGDQAPARDIPEMDLPRISTARLVPDYIRQLLMPKIVAE